MSLSPHALSRHPPPMLLVGSVNNLTRYPELRALVGAEAAATAFACTSGVKEHEQEALRGVFRAFVHANTDSAAAQVQPTAVQHVIGFPSPRVCTCVRVVVFFCFLVSAFSSAVLRSNFRTCYGRNGVRKHIDDYVQGASITQRLTVGRTMSSFPPIDIAECAKCSQSACTHNTMCSHELR